MIDTDTYLEALRKRRAKSRVRTKHQLLGLVIAELLGDRTHKSLYIKLAKAVPGEILLSIARDVADRTNVKERGAYFMRIVDEEGLLEKMYPKKPAAKPTRPKKKAAKKMPKKSPVPKKRTR